jgi:DNA-binding GntR family transcriptional regulator
MVILVTIARQRIWRRSIIHPESETMAGPRKKDYVYDWILSGLLSRRYRFGDKIFVKEISAELGVSRQPVMTALNGLSAEGFVTITAQVGCDVIAPPEREIEDFFRMFGRFEGFVSELAAARHNDVDLRRLEQINARIRGLGDDPERNAEDYRMLNQDFHDHIHQSGRSATVSHRHMAVFTMADFFIVQTCGFAVLIPGAADEHARMIAAIAARDPQRARAEAEAHIASVTEAVTGRDARPEGACLDGVPPEGDCAIPGRRAAPPLRPSSQRVSPFGRP